MLVIAIDRYAPSEAVLVLLIIGLRGKKFDILPGLEVLEIPETDVMSRRIDITARMSKRFFWEMAFI